MNHLIHIEMLGLCPACWFGIAVSICLLSHIARMLQERRSNKEAGDLKSERGRGHE